MTFEPTNLPAPEVLLAVITLIPVLVAWALGLFSSASEPAGVITLGNPLRTSGVVFDHDPVHEPVVHLSRTETTRQLRDLALGLRNSPVEKAAPLLKHFMESGDPELALFAQSTLQQGREKLQAAAGRLQNHHAQTDPRIAAAVLETGLRLASPALTAPGEREGRVQTLAKKASEQLSSCEHTPRLLAACVRVFLTAGIPEKADAITRSMPEDSDLRRALEPDIRFAMHIKACAAAR